MAAQQYATDEEGNRIIEASRRPDGSLRKKIKVRPGYVPQDEQARFTSSGARARQGAPRVPGMDDSELDAAKDAAGGRAPAARRRRPKKAADPATEPAAASTDTAAAEMTRLKLAEPAQAASSSSQPEAAPEHDPDKLARSLRKKLAACEALTSRKAAGESLTGPELDKLAKAVGWQRELEELQTAQ